MRSHLEALLNRGLNGAEIKIRAPGLLHTVVFYKYIKAEGDYGIELVLRENGETNDPWTEFKEYCSDAKIPSTHYEMSDYTGHQVLRADCGKDLDKACQLFNVIMCDILKISGSGAFEISAEKLSPWMEIIDKPDQTSADSDVGMKLNREWFQSKFGYPLWMAELEFLMGISLFVGIVGLLLTIVFGFEKIGGAVLLNFEYVNVNIPIIGILFVCLILFGFSAVFLDSYYITSRANDVGKCYRIPKSIGGILRAFFGRIPNWLAIVVLIIACVSWVQ